ncbi:hypothetical protein CCH79_00005106 [Gambusia affinis]|uniref:Uncharacterized protein n=3 Tax=Gnathostomata TaxID=7776 RepID=A0A315VPY3_GAMAF|nr:hypothetical protein CCH79_00005106 [Gambusia affinis]
MRASIAPQYHSSNVASKALTKVRPSISSVTVVTGDGGGFHSSVCAKREVEPRVFGASWLRVSGTHLLPRCQTTETGKGQGTPSPSTVQYVCTHGYKLKHLQAELVPRQLDSLSQFHLQLLPVPVKVQSCHPGRGHSWQWGSPAVIGGVRGCIRLLHLPRVVLRSNSIRHGHCGRLVVSVSVILPQSVEDLEPPVNCGALGRNFLPPDVVLFLVAKLLHVEAAGNPKARALRNSPLGVSNTGPPGRVSPVSPLPSCSFRAGATSRSSVSSPHPPGQTSPAPLTVKGALRLVDVLGRAAGGRCCVGKRTRGFSRDGETKQGSPAAILDSSLSARRANERLCRLRVSERTGLSSHGAPTRPDITGRGSVVVEKEEEEVVEVGSRGVLPSPSHSEDRKEVVKFIYVVIILVFDLIHPSIIRRMSGSRPQQSGGGASSVPGTSSSSSSTGGSGSNAVTSNGPASGNVVPSRTLGATNEAGSFASLTSRPSASSGSRKKSLHQAPLYNGLLNSYEDKSNDFVCPICFEMIEEAHMTNFKCIRQSLEDSNRCPKCNYIVDNVDQLYPNFLVNELILKQKQRSEEKRLKLDHPNWPRWQVFQDILSPDQENLDLANVNLMLELLVQKKKQLEAESQAAQRQILMEFLKEARRNKREQLDQLQKELNFLEEDIKRVEDVSGISSPTMEAECTVPNVEAPSLASSIIEPPDYNQTPGFGATTPVKRQTWYNSTLASRRKRLTAHFEDLEQCYFSNKMSRITDEGRNLNQLEDFMECLSKFTRYNTVRPLATLSYASDLYNGSSIVSSIEFDRDCDYFAIAGVTKKIKVFEYGTVIQDAVDIHYPVNEMTCNSKISCISWSSYHKNLLASSDYEGTVILWDGFTGQRSKVYQEHEKRCWSVDFNLMDPKLLASGSDDAKVKLWSTNLDNSVASIEAKANVCCVKFSPTSRYHLAFGCADHCVHYYDLRNTKQPIMVFKGHRKAVSYAKFVNGEEIVSASTDSQLKLWNVNKPHCLRSFKGHINEKNFVGLASNGDYVACGSENNSLYLYYKGLSKTLLTFKFDTVKSVLDKDKKEDDTNEFVSAVCWRALPDGESNVLIAANSQGTIKQDKLGTSSSVKRLPF